MRNLIGLENMVGQWNLVLSREIKTLLRLDAPYVYFRAARDELDRIEKEEGVSLVKETPLETINAVYGYFVKAGFFTEARAESAGTDELGREVCEFYEKECRTFDLSHWNLCASVCASPLCLCHNMIRAALYVGFSLAVDVFDTRLDEGAKEEFVKAALVAEEMQGGRNVTLFDDMKNYRAGFDTVSRAIEMSIDAIVSIDEKGRIMLWNQAAEKLFGYTKEEAVGMDVTMLMPEDIREKHSKGVERFLRTGETEIIGKVVDIEGRDKSGELIPLEMSISAEKIGGRWTFMAIIRDVRVRKKLEDELRTRLVEMERVMKLMVGREIKMEELRREIADLRNRTALMK